MRSALIIPVAVAVPFGGLERRGTVAGGVPPCGERCGHDILRVYAHATHVEEKHPVWAFLTFLLLPVLLVGGLGDDCTSARRALVILRETNGKKTLVSYKRQPL